MIYIAPISEIKSEALRHILVFQLLWSSNNLFSSSILIQLSAYSQLLLFVYPEVPNNGILSGKAILTGLRLFFLVVFLHY